MRLCDLHCDTLYEIIKREKRLYDFDGHLSLEGLGKYEGFIQVMAMWSENKRSVDENYDAFLCAAGVLENELAYADKIGCKVRLAKSGADIIKNESEGYSSIVFAVEGAKLLDSSIARLEMLYSLGVRLLTLVWAGVCPMGGAHDNNEPLTEFGLEVVKKCFELGIIPDVSHANARQTDQVIGLAHKYSKPIVATHSNSNAVHGHTRNLSDEHYKAIVSLGGVVGVSTACEHLSSTDASVKNMVKHILHYYSLAPNGVCLGCDLDGVERLPAPLKSVADISMLSDLLAAEGISDIEIQNIMYNNARDFLVNNLGRI
ncbi:MAG: membrane dipeptidase [Clostridia bacterium]|nr:membrane dipeptidase [Clostridia bacterium]